MFWLILRSICRPEALFRGLFRRPDVENPEVVEEGQDGDHADRRDHVLMVRAKPAVFLQYEISRADSPFIGGANRGAMQREC